MEKVHWPRAVCGVGPADRTGKSLVTYWPGGTRPAFSAGSSRLRWNPRETGLMTALLPHLSPHDTWNSSPERANKSSTAQVGRADDHSPSHAAIGSTSAR